MKKEVSIFEYATRNKLRFPFKGTISTEDLWDLSLDCLDSIYKTLNKQAKESEEDSLLSVKTEVDEKLEVQIAIIKHIVTVKYTEKEAREKEAEISARKQEILAIKASRSREALQNASDEELDQMLADLENQ